jgi:chromosome segregation and condensation protein ScpB
VGRPALFGITFEFLRYFGLEEMGELPELALPQVEPPENGADADESGDDGNGNQ